MLNDLVTVIFFIDCHHVLNVLSLWCARKIDFHTVVHALKNRPIAVAGRGGSYQVDPIDPNE